MSLRNIIKINHVIHTHVCILHTYSIIKKLYKYRNFKLAKLHSTNGLESINIIIIVECQ